MPNENLEETDPTDDRASQANVYDPFARGAFPVGVRTIQMLDQARNRLFPCEVWYPAATQYKGQDISAETQDLFSDPSSGISRRQMAVRDAAAQPGTYPLILFSHSSGGGRRQSTFLCTHLSSHGYIVAALDHSEAIASELTRREAEMDEQRAMRVDAWIANRVPDIQFLLDQILDYAAWESESKIDPARIGIVGHSFGGWTALAAPETEKRIQAVVALSPGGSSHPKPGIIPAKLTFRWVRDVPTLYLVAENDTMTPLSGMYELFERTPEPKQMVILRRADHLHFVDDVEETHESVRAMPFADEEMLPITELSTGEQAHLFTRGLALAHLDANLKQLARAQQFWLGDLEAELTAGGIEAVMQKH